MERNPTNWVMDYETMINCTVACFEDYKTEETKTFIIHELQNDFLELYQFLEENKKYKERHISFNGLGFDSQITEFILRNKGMFNWMSAPEICTAIYLKAH